MRIQFKPKLRCCVAELRPPGWNFVILSTNMNHQQVLDLFVDQNVLQKTQADDVLTEAQQNGKTIVQAMVDSGFMDESGFYHTVAEGIGAQFIDLNECEIVPEVVKLVPAGLARLHRALPVDLVDNTLRVALADPLEPRTAEDLRFALGRDIEVVVAPVEQIEDRIRIFYGSDTSSMEEVLKQLGEVGELMQLREGDGASGAEAEANATPIIRFVDLILYQAIQDRASDIHFEPFENEFKIRYRVDGALYEMAPPPRHLALPVISRVKVMANMNIAERRLPQDGRIQKNIGGRNVDLRVSTLPTQFGESVVLRVLDRSTVNLDLEMLGMPKYVYDYIHEVIERPNGIFIVTGPTGSGKTTTLYSCLRKINTLDSKLLTAEEPVEYDLEGIMQVPVNENIGLTFARVLRAFLRQDPGSDHGRRNTRFGDGADCDSSVPHRPFRFHHPAYERCARGDHAFDRHGRGTIFDLLHARSRPRPAIASEYLSKLSGQLTSPTKHSGSTRAKPA